MNHTELILLILLCTACVSSHGGLVNVVLSVRSVTGESVAAMIANSPNLTLYHVHIDYFPFVGTTFSFKLFDTTLKNVVVVIICVWLKKVLTHSLRIYTSVARMQHFIDLNEGIMFKEVFVEVLLCKLIAIYTLVHVIFLYVFHIELILSQFIH